MSAITIDIPDYMRDELAARAARSGQSLQEYLLDELKELVAPPTPDEWWAQVRERARGYDSSMTAEDIVSTLREIRGE